MMARFPLLAAIMAAAIVLSGCSFHPLFANGSSVHGGPEVFHTIYVDPIDAERGGYELRDSLIDLLEGTSHQTAALYRLKVDVKQTVEGTAIETTGDITRYTYTMVADFELSDIHTGAEITKGSETSVQGYDVVASPYATLVAQQDAQKFAARDIADRIRVDIGVFFHRRAGA